VRSKSLARRFMHLRRCHVSCKQTNARSLSHHKRQLRRQWVSFGDVNHRWKSHCAW